MDVALVEGLAEGVNPYHRHNQRRAIRDHGFVIGGGLEGPHAGAVGLDQYISNWGLVIKD
jgi:hypothetical protein